MNSLLVLLRGINVGSKNRITMDELKRVFSIAGMPNTSTYIQSGNVIVHEDPFKKEALQEALKNHFKENIPCISMDKQTLLQILDISETLLKENNKFIDRACMHVSIFEEEPSASCIDASLEPYKGKEVFHFQGRYLFMYCPMGYHTSKLTPGYLERKCKVAVTARNLKTLSTLETLL